MNEYTGIDGDERRDDYLNVQDDVIENVYRLLDDAREHVARGAWGVKVTRQILYRMERRASAATDEWAEADRLHVAYGKVQMVETAIESLLEGFVTTMDKLAVDFPTVVQDGE